MEPGHEDREYISRTEKAPSITVPQWSPAMKTGNTCPRGAPCATCRMPQWSPAMKTGNTSTGEIADVQVASLNGARP